MNEPAQPKKLLLSIRDPLLLDGTVSPLLKPEGELRGFMPVDFWKSMAYGREETDKVFFDDPLFKTLTQNFKDFCRECSEGGSADYSRPPQAVTIPPLIHFIWLGSPLPKEFGSVVESWRRCHPGWQIRIWSENDLRDFRWSDGYARWLFENSKNWGEKADILRYEVLYAFGGVYSDVDALCYKSFNDLISTRFSFFAGQETNKINDSGGNILYLANSIIGAAKGHPLIKGCLDSLVSQAEAPQESIMARTGPLLLTRACRKCLKAAGREDILILPCSYLYPLPHFKNLLHKALTAQEIKAHFLSQEALTLHLWAATWYLE